MSRRLELIGLEGFPRVRPGDDLANLIADALTDNDLSPGPDDVLIVAQKVVSKAEGRYVRLAGVEPGREALSLAEATHKDPRQVELVLRESREVLRSRPGVIIVEHRLGYVHANAGIDRSNIPQDAADPQVLLLPEDPDRSAAGLRRDLAERFGSAPAIIINDSAGRAWRNGTVGIAIGSAGLAPLWNQVGAPDLYGRALEVTEPAVADELAAAASLVMGQAAEGIPVVLARGARLQRAEVGSRALLRERAMDMFR
jgi:coenzyme F420-0:L-glutamate ligase/coenzyme F420-1:gamma-L-glutamate ligase